MVWVKKKGGGRELREEGVLEFPEIQTMAVGFEKQLMSSEVLRWKEQAAALVHIVSLTTRMN